MAVQGRGQGGGRQGNRRAAGAPGKRRPSRRQRAIYRRRRIVVAIGLVVALALVVFCGYSLVRLGMATVGAADAALRREERAALARDAAPTPKATTGVKDCTSSAIRLELAAKTPAVPVGGTLEWEATIIHRGNGSCLIDGSDSSRVLTISSGDQVIWRSDVCPADPRRLLMAKGDKDTRAIAWPAVANAGQDGCRPDDQLPRVVPGTYVGVLSLKSDPKVTSDPVTVLVQ